ncbi:MAG: putative lipid II flippase FtsW [bacterium]
MSAVASIRGGAAHAVVPSIALGAQAERKALGARVWTIELAFAVLTLLGLALVWSASSAMALARHGSSSHFFVKQLVWALLACVGFFAASRTPLPWIRRGAGLALPLLSLALVYLLIPGVAGERGGATRWIVFHGVSLQPGEPTKVALVLFLARWLARRPAPSGKQVLEALAIAAVPAGLVYRQPDLGTAVVLTASALAMLYLAGARPLHVAGVVLAALPLLPLALIGHAYRWHRLIAFWNPWENARTLGYQIVQSFVAFGSGGVFGRGLGGGAQKLFYLPESHTDFVFAVLGEEMGFLGVVCVATLFLLLVVQGSRVALAARDRFGFLVAAGLTALIGLEAAANMAVTLGIVPTKGLALPFLSYGGSALLSSAIALGFVLAIDRDSALGGAGGEDSP